MLSSSMSYVIGFIQGDGHLQHKKLTIELQAADEDVLRKIGYELNSDFVISYRKRNTNFKNNYEACQLAVHSVSLTKRLNELGVPYGKKSNIIQPPGQSFSEADYLRGLYDADGSLGLTSEGIPYISLVTSSEYVKDFLLNFINQNLGLIKYSTKNKRDGVFNISLFRGHAQDLIKILYYQDCICLNRKLENARMALAWTRPTGTRYSPNARRWTDSEDQIVLKSTDLRETSKQLGRSLSSVKTRKWRLEHCG
jgi:hypothetical protein